MTSPRARLAKLLGELGRPASPAEGQPWWRQEPESPHAVSRPWLLSTAVVTATICVAFVIVFRFQIAPTFSYGGLVYREPNYFLLLASVVLAWLLVLALGAGPLRGSRILLAFLVYLLGIPVLVIPNIIDIAPIGTSFGLVLVYFLCLLLVIVGVRIAPLWVVPRPSVPEWVVVSLLLLATAITFAVLERYVGINWRPSSIVDIYGVRAEYSKALGRAPAALGYLIALQMKAVGPALLVVALVSRRWRWLAAIGVASQYLLFATTYAKQSLFSIAAIIVVYGAFRFMRQADQRVIAFAVVLATVATSVADWLRGGVYWTEIIIDRFFFWPGFLPVQFYETFHILPFNLWGDSSLRGIVPDQSPGAVPELVVGQALTGNSGVYANTSFLGDGYANLGFGGVLIEAFALIAIVYAVGLASHRFPAWTIGPLMIMPAVALSNGSPLTAIFSGGVLPVILILWLSPTTLLAGDDYRKTETAKVRVGTKRPTITLVTGYFDEFSGYYEVSLARELSKQFDVTVIAGDRVAPVFGAEALRVVGQSAKYDVGRSGTKSLEVVRLPYRKVGSLLIPSGMTRKLRAQPADVVLVLAVGQGFSLPGAFFPRRALRVAIFGDNRAQWSTVTRIVRPLKWLAFSVTKGVMYWLVMQRSSLIYGVTPNTLKRLENFSAGREMRLWPLPVDPEVFAYDACTRNSVRTRLGLSDVSIGVVGKASSEKQIERVVDVFSELIRDGLRCRLVISGVGQDTYSADLRTRIEYDPLLAGNVELLGYLRSEELAELMSGLDICVWPVQPAITIQQAVVMGCRVVVPDNDLVGFLTNGAEFGATFVPDDWSSLRTVLEAEVVGHLGGRERDSRVKRAQELTVSALTRQLLCDLQEVVDR